MRHHFSSPRCRKVLERQSAIVRVREVSSPKQEVMLCLFRPLVSSSCRITSCCTVLALSVFASRPSLTSSLLVTSPLSTSCAVESSGSATRKYSTPAFQSSDASVSTDSMLQVAQFPCLSDNYGYLIHDPNTGATAAVDTPEAKPYEAELEKRGWKLSHILNTHHHHDHTGGNTALSKGRELAICGPESEKIPGRTVALRGGDEITFGSQKVIIIDVGGHTLGHIAYYFPDSKKVFVGDSLFTLVSFLH